MRIIFIAEHYPPDPGGVATSAQRVARALVSLGHEVILICFDSSGPLEGDDYILSECDNGVQVYRIGPFFLRHPSLNEISLSEKLRAVFRRRALAQMVQISRPHAPDLILSFYLLNSGFLARFLAAQLKVPCFVGVRGNDIGLNIFHVERFAAIQWIVSGAQGIACVNAHLYDRLIMTFPEVAAKSRVIPNGVPLSTQLTNTQGYRSLLTQNTGWKHSDLIAVFIGTLREKKGIVYLLRAIEKARRSIPIRLLVIGPDIGNVEQRLCGNLWTTLKEEGTVHLTGQVSRPEVLEWASGGDLLVMPSVEDGLANGLLEGMALGLCPIVTDIFSDVVQADKTGWIVAPANADALAAALISAASSREKLTSIGLRARDHVRSHHSSEQEAREYLDLFSEFAKDWRPA